MQARSHAMCLTLLLCSGLATAQLLPDSPDWRESEVPPPPAFDVKRLIRVPGPDGSSSVSYTHLTLPTSDLV